MTNRDDQLMARALADTRHPLAEQAGWVDVAIPLSDAEMEDGAGHAHHVSAQYPGTHGNPDGRQVRV